MIFQSQRLPVNGPGEDTPVDREQLWQGLVAKASNALPFVPMMTRCAIVARHDENTFDRDISLRGQDYTERITLEPPHRVVFTRVAGPVLGTIANEIEGSGDELSLRFSFALVVHGMEGGSTAEKEYSDGMAEDYLQAVASTLDAVRRAVRDHVDLAAALKS